MNRRTLPPHVFIYFTAFLATMGGGLVMPVLPRLLQEVTGRDIAGAGVSYGLLLSVFAIAMLLTSKLLGRLSDAYGRRRVILIALAGTTIDYIAAATTQSLWVLIVTRIVAGCCGATLVVCNAYLIDMTPQEQRAVRFGMLKGVLAAGMTLGPLIGGVLGGYSTRAPFWAAAAVCGVSVLYGLLVLPESLQAENRRPFSWTGALPFYMPKLGGVSIPFGVLVTLLLFELGTSLPQPIIALYTQLRLGWTPETLGLYLGISGVLAIGGQAGLTRLLVPRLGERRAVWVGLSIFSLTLVLFGLTSQSWQLYVVMIVAQFGYIGIPALIAVISRYATSKAQGELMGLLVAVSIVAQIVAPLLGTWLFAEFSVRDGAVYLPGLPYFVGAGVVAASVVCAWMTGMFNGQSVPAPAPAPPPVAEPLAAVRPS